MLCNISLKIFNTIFQIQFAPSLSDLDRRSTQRSGANLESCGHFNWVKNLRLKHIFTCEDLGRDIKGLEILFYHKDV